MCGKWSTRVPIASVLQYYENPKSAALVWGKENEKLAKQKYLKSAGAKHKKLKLSDTGLWISKEFPFIAASPDGICKCACCDKPWLLEVKCPYGYRLQTVTEYSKNKQSCLSLKDRKYTLKESYQKYTQVQTQLFCAGMDMSHLIIFTRAPHNNMAIIEVKRGDDCIKKIIERAVVFFKCTIFPELQSQTVEFAIIQMYAKKSLKQMVDLQ